MGWGLGDIVDSVSDGIGGFLGGSEETGGGGLGSWLSTGVDWLWNNMDDIMDIGGFVYEQYNREEQQDDLDHIAKKQAKELQNVADAKDELLYD